MKKGIAVVSAFAMAAVMCAGFAACGSDSEAKKIVSDEVTQAEWKAAFAQENFTNCKLEFTEIYESKSGNLSAKTTATNTMIQDGEKFYVKKEVVNKGNVNEFYLPEGKTEVYWIDGSSYTVTEKGVSVKDGVGTRSIYNNIPNAKDKYEDFEYSKEEQGYVSKQAVSNSRDGIIYKFKDGKLVAIFSSNTETFDVGTETMTFEYVFTYGGQTVTLPKV